MIASIELRLDRSSSEPSYI